MTKQLEALAKELGYWTAHGLILVAFLLTFKSIAAGRVGEHFPGLRAVAAAA